MTENQTKMTDAEKRFETKFHEMTQIFPREEKTGVLFRKILNDPEACRRLKETFYDGVETFMDENGGELPSRQFAAALLSAYHNRDLSALLMALCGNTMFDLLRNAFLAPLPFNQDGEANPEMLTDASGDLLPDPNKRVNKKVYRRFKNAFDARQKGGMYLAYGYRKQHVYTKNSMDTVTERIGEHIGVLLMYELPDTVTSKTEAQAYADVWELFHKIQQALPRALVYYGQDALEKQEKRYDGLGVFLPMDLFSRALEHHIAIVDGIVYEAE